MRAADLPFGSIIADGPRVLVKLKDTDGRPWVEAMNPEYAARPSSDDDVDYCLVNGYTVVRRGLGEVRA